MLKVSVTKRNYNFCHFWQIFVRLGLPLAHTGGLPGPGAPMLAAGGVDRGVDRGVDAPIEAAG